MSHEFSKPYHLGLEETLSGLRSVFLLKKIWGRANGFTDDYDHNHLGFAVGGEEKQELTTDLIQNESLKNFFGYFWTLCGVFKNHLISKNWPLENPEPCACSHVPNLKALSFCQYLQIYDHMTMTTTISYYLPLEYLARSGEKSMRVPRNIQ